MVGAGSGSHCVITKHKHVVMVSPQQEPKKKKRKANPVALFIFKRVEGWEGKKWEKGKALDIILGFGSLQKRSTSYSEDFENRG